MSDIHPKAFIEDGAEIGENVTIEPFAVVKKDVVLKNNTIIKSHAYIGGHTTIGEGSVIWPGAVIGTKTQNLKYRGEKTYVKIGKNCQIREYTTINSSCGEGSVVSIGDECLIMSYCHIAHNCQVGNRVIMTNNAMLAGYVVIEDYAVIGGMTPVHQYSRIGKYAMVGGFSRVSNDVPPYTVGGGFPYKFGGINIVGLKRHGFSLEVRKHLSKAFRITYRSGLRLDDALKRMNKEVELIPEVMHWIHFCHTSKRGLIGLKGICQKQPEELSQEELDDIFAAEKI